MTAIEYVVKARTPEDIKDAIVKWLEEDAIKQRIIARMASGKHKQEQGMAVAAAIEAKAAFIKNIIIEQI